MTDAIEIFRLCTPGLPEDILQCRLAGDFQTQCGSSTCGFRKRIFPRPCGIALTAEREMILRLPEEFPFSRAEALALVRQRIPDFYGRGI